MTTEMEIFKKYKPTEDGWISNTKFKHAIHEAYEAGRVEEWNKVIKPTEGKSEIAKQTAQAIFEELKQKLCPIVERDSDIQDECVWKADHYW